MRVPYSIQGALFSPALIGLILALKVTCPVPTGGGCFADNFAVPLFLPSIFAHKIFGSVPAFVINYEFLIIVLYWSFVGFLIGFCFDILVERSKESDIN
jgi:hypothetical protein